MAKRKRSAKIKKNALAGKKPKRITAKQRSARKINIEIARRHKKNKARKKAGKKVSGALGGARNPTVALLGKKGKYYSGQKITVSGKKGTIIPNNKMQAYVFRAKGSVRKAKRLGFKSDHYDRRLSSIDEMFIK